MKSTIAFVIALAAAAAADAPKPPSSEGPLVSHVADAKWVAPKLDVPPGLMASPIAADPATGAPIGYTKLPAGYVFPLHWHSHAEYTSLISGKLILTIAGKPNELAPGSYVVIPAKTEHKAECAAGAECILLTRRGGPADYHFVK
jgi:quercetin dioxygenase-like cupin family protein